MTPHLFDSLAVIADFLDCQHRFAGIEGFLDDLGVPYQILVAVFPKLSLYGFWPAEGCFAELLRVLEEVGATGLGGWSGALLIVGIGPASASVHLFTRGAAVAEFSFWPAGPGIG